MQSADGRQSIGIVSWDYDVPRGGLGRSMQRIAEALRERHVPIHCLTAPDVASGALLRLLRRPGGHIIGSRLLARAVPAFVTRHAITTLLYPVGPGGVRGMPRIPGVRLLAIAYHVYGQQVAHVPGEGWKRMFLAGERRDLRRADAVLCYSADTLVFLGERYALPQDKCVLLPEIFDAIEWSSAAKKEQGLCICVARLERRKNVEVLLQAWPSVRASHPGARLLIVGDGGLRGRIDRLIRLCDGASRVPALSQAELRELAGRAEIAACPAYLEGFGLAAAESMACGAAVVAADAPGLRSLIRHGENGFLVPPDRPDAWSEAICRCLSSRELCARVGSRAQADIWRHFQKDLAIDALLNVIRAA